MSETGTGAPFMVRMNEDRFGKPVRFLNGRFDTKVSARDTNGAWCVFDTFRTRPGGPPRHSHFSQGEWFFVIEGDFIFEIGDQRFDAHDGDTVFGPRNVPHAFASLTPTARLVVLFQPALRIEEFFAAELLDPLSEEFARLSREHDMQIVGPPIAI